MDANFDPRLGRVTKTPDPGITEKLKKESPGIFNYCFEKYMEAKKRGYFTYSETVNTKTDEMFAESNPIFSYLKETMDFKFIENEWNVSSYNKFTENIEYHKQNAKTVGEDQLSDEDTVVFVTTNKVRQDCTYWCEENGYKSKFSISTFSQELHRILKRTMSVKMAEELKHRRVIDGKRIRGILLPWKPFMDV
jgi:phage/plasmid-associated DNA primase